MHSFPAPRHVHQSQLHLHLHTGLFSGPSHVCSRVLLGPFLLCPSTWLRENEFSCFCMVIRKQQSAPPLASSASSCVFRMASSYRLGEAATGKFRDEGFIHCLCNQIIHRLLRSLFPIPRPVLLPWRGSEA